MSLNFVLKVTPIFNLDLATFVKAWDQALQRRGRREGGKGGEAGRGKGGEAWLYAFDTAVPWYHALIGQIRSAVDSIAIFQNHAPSIREMTFLKQGFRASNANFGARLFAYRLAQRKYICLWSIAKRKSSIQNIDFITLSSCLL